MCSIFKKEKRQEIEELIPTNLLTLIDAFNQFWKVCEDGDRRSLTSAGLTYYYLCNVWNTCGRPLSFRRQNTILCAELGISKPTLERHRNVLKQAGIINFFSKGKGDPNITYQILERRSSKIILLPDNEKENNFTSHVTSPVTSDDVYKQSTENQSTERESKKNLLAPLETEKEKKEQGMPPPNFSPPLNLKGSILFREPVIPTFEEVHMVFLQNGGTEEMAKRFFDKNVATGWFLNGSPIVNFRNLVASFVSNWNKNELKKEKNGNNFKKYAQTIGQSMDFDQL